LTLANLNLRRRVKILQKKIKNKEETMNVFEKVKALIVDELNIDASKVKLETSLVDDLGADSLDAVELIMAIEDEFGIEISDEAAQKMKRVQDIVGYIENLKK
jgi:acyl carrier protein